MMKTNRRDEMNTRAATYLNEFASWSWITVHITVPIPICEHHGASS